MIDKKWKGRIITAMRKLSFSYPPRNAAKNKQKKAPATFECESCKVWIYEGSKTLDKHLEKLDISPSQDIIKGKTNCDHKLPVIPILGFSRDNWDWDEYINRLFCPEDQFQILCESCHKEKTKEEDEQRKLYRQRKKK